MTLVERTHKAPFSINPSRQPARDLAFESTKWFSILELTSVLSTWWMFQDWQNQECNVRVVAWGYKRVNCFKFQNITFTTISGSPPLPLAKFRERLTPLTQIHLYSQCNFLLYLQSEYGGGASLKACTVAYRSFLLMYSTESVESHSGIICDSDFGFDQTDILPQFIQDVKAYTNLGLGIHGIGMYWLCPKDT